MKRHPPSADDSKAILSRLHQLFKSHERLIGKSNRDPFSLGSLSLRSPSDIATAKLLNDALEAARINHYHVAEPIVQKALELAPDYFEVHRVDAMVKSGLHDVVAARSAYEAAVQLAPRSAPLRFWYGGFLLRLFDDAPGCLVQLQAADRLAPKTPQIRSEISRVLLYQHEYSQAREIIDDLLDQLRVPAPDGAGWLIKKVYDLHFQYFTRQAESFLDQHDYSECTNLLCELFAEFQKCPERAIDDKLRERLRSGSHLANPCMYAATDDNTYKTLFDLEASLSLAAAPLARKSTPLSIGSLYEGRVMSIRGERRWAFAETQDGHSIFFHSSEMSPIEWQRLNVGDQVRFVAAIDEGRRSPKGTNVQRLKES